MAKAAVKGASASSQAPTNSAISEEKSQNKEPQAADKVEKKQLDKKGPDVVVPLAAASMKQAQETLSKTNKIGNLGEEQLYQPAFLPDSACDGNEKAPNFQPRGQSQGPPNQESGPGGAHQGPPQGQQPPRGGPGGADTQAPPPASTPPQGPPSLGHNGPPAPQQQQQQQSQQPPQGPPAHSGPPSGTSTLTRERKRIAIIDPTTRQEVSVDGTSADKKVRVHPRVLSVLTPFLTQKLRYCHFPRFLHT